MLKGKINHTVGIDIIEVKRFRILIEKNHFLKKIYTDKEIEYCSTKKRDEKIQSYAARFAAKEAVKKSLSKLVDYNKIEILTDKDGKPAVNFLDYDLRKKYISTVSLSHTREFAVASCLTYNI